MNEHGYNGYRNYQTWNAALWLTNTEGDYRYFESRIAELLEDNDGNQAKAYFALADEIRDMIEEGNPIEGAGMYSDILTAALQDIDYLAVARNFGDYQEGGAE